MSVWKVVCFYVLCWCFVDLFCCFVGTATVSSCAKKPSKPLKKEHKNRNNKKMRRKNESGVVMVCVLLLIFYMIKKGITLCCFESVVVVVLLKKKIFKRKVDDVYVKFLTFPFFLRTFSYSHVHGRTFFPIEQFLLWKEKIENSSPAQKKWMTSSYPMMSKIGHSSCLFGPCKSSHFVGTF